LLSTAHEAFVRREASWDLLGLVIIGGMVAALFQARPNVLTRRWALVSAATAVMAALVAAVPVYMKA
jgi:hypothetical protein